MIFAIAGLFALFGSSLGLSQSLDNNSQAKKGISILPVVAANSTYGLMVGGALFYHQPIFDQKLKTSLMTIYSRNNQTFNGIDINLKSSRWLKGAKVTVTDFFDSFYNESREIRKDPPDRICVFDSKYELYGAFRHNNELSTKFSWLQKRRTEQGKVYRVKTHEISNIKYYPDEITNAFGLATTFDATEEAEISTLGKFLQFDWKVMPGGKATSVKNQKRFQQFDLDLRYYYEIYAPLVHAARIYLGQSIGQPTYLFRYRLGGDLLRGYRYSRFKGNKIYAIQNEFRFPIWGVVSGNIFGSVGDTVDTRFAMIPFYCYGFGFKINIPPDYVAKVRFDFGFSKESMNMLMEANHAF